MLRFKQANKIDTAIYIHIYMCIYIYVYVLPIALPIVLPIGIAYRIAYCPGLGLLGALLPSASGLVSNPRRLRQHAESAAANAIQPIH